MQELQNDLNKVTEFLTPFLPLANAHTVDFIVDNLWEKKIPSDVRREVECTGVAVAIEHFWHLLQENETASYPKPIRLFNFVQKAGEFVIEKLNSVHYVEDLTNVLLDSSASNLKEFVEVTEYMSTKKLHEVRIMSNVVACLAKASKSSVVVDIGSGKGYLPSILALNHNLRILGIDDKPTNINGAVQTMKKLEKNWKMYQKKSISKQGKCKFLKNVHDDCKIREEAEIRPHQNPIDSTQPTVVENSYKQRVECVSSQTDVGKILSEEYPEESQHNVLIVGLHTCGNLSPDSLKLFINCDVKVKSVINIGCCYHLINEEFSVDSHWLRRGTVIRNPKSIVEFGFPLSEFLRAQKFSLGRDARMCGTQNPLKIFKEQELIKATKPLYYRALLQKLLTLKCGPANLPDTIVGRMAHKCVSFAEYATKALKKLDLPFQVSTDELDMFESNNDEHWQRLKIFFLLKTALSAVVETVILLDKLLYLFEKGTETAFITRLFDPIVSPRCYAVVAIKGAEK